MKKHQEREAELERANQAVSGGLTGRLVLAFVGLMFAIAWAAFAGWVKKEPDKLGYAIPLGLATLAYVAGIFATRRFRRKDFFPDSE